MTLVSISEYSAFDQGPHILAAVWFMTILGMLGVGGRMFIRYMVLKRGSPDDWWMLSGVTFLVILAALVTRIADLGGFKHETELSPGVASTVRQLFWAAQPVGLIGSFLPKVSIGIQLLHILPQSSSYAWQRWLIYASLATCGIMVAIGFPIIFAQCNPPSALYEPAASYPKMAYNPRCWSPSVNTSFFAFSAVWNALIDLLLAVIPIALIWGLQIKMLKKILLVNFLGARCFACISGVTRAIYVSKYSFYGTGIGTQHDFTAQAFNILLWQVAEQFCLCFCGSVPAYKAVFDRWLSQRSTIRASSILTYVNDTKVSRISRAYREKDWFYERTCFDHTPNPHITVTTEINIESQSWTHGSAETLDAGIQKLNAAHVRCTNE